MGGSKSKLSSKISYKSRYFPNIITIDLSEPYDYPNRPHKQELNKQLSEILSEIQLISEIDHSIINNFPKSLKWKLICKHREYITENLASISEIDKTVGQLMIEIIKSGAEIQQFYNWILRASFEDLQSFYNYGGIKCIFEVLKVSELCARNTGNYKKSIQILRVLLFISRDKIGVKQIYTVNNGISLLFLNFNDLQVEVTSLVLEIINQLLWESENDEKTLGFVFEALTQYKLENRLKYRFESLLKILRESRNIILITNILEFIITIVSAPIDLDKRNALKAEFVGMGIEELFIILREKIENKMFRIEDCTIEATNLMIESRQKQALKTFEKTFTISEFAINQDQIEQYENYAASRFKNKNKNYKDELLKFQKDSHNSTPTHEESLEPNRNFMKMPTLLEKNYYLNINDTELFEDYLKGVVCQIEVFERLDNEENINKKSVDLKNPDLLFKELREQAKKLDVYSHLLTILQKLRGIQNSEGGVIYESLEEFLKFMLELNTEENQENPQIKAKDIRKLLKDGLKYKEMENKLEQMQINIVNQEKTIAKLKSNSGNFSQTLPIQNLLPPPPNILPNIGIPPPIIGVPPLNIGLPPINIGLPPPILNISGPPPILNIGGPPPLPIGLKGGPPNINLQNNNKPLLSKNKKKPNVPLKNLMWTVIPTSKITNTIWEKIDDSNVKIDIEHIEKEFANLKVSKEIKNDDKEKSIKKEEIIKISVLPPEKSKNIEIILGKLKLDPYLVSNALLECDLNFLTLNILESLISMLPNESDLKPLLSFDGEKENLANPEKFLLILMNVDGFIDRIYSFRFSLIYDEIIEDIENKIDSLTKVWSEIISDRKMHILMENILAFGNYLNGESIRGGAFGFRLDSLEKLNDLKNNEGKKNLLMVIIEFIEKNNIIIIDENLDLSDYDLAAKIPISQLWVDFAEIKKGIKSMNNALKQKEKENNDKIDIFLTPLIGKLEIIAKNIEEKIKKCENFYENAAIYFLENPKDSSEKLGEKIFKFWYACRNSKRMLIKDKENLKKKEEKQKQKLNEEPKIKTFKNDSTLKPNITTNNNKNSSAILETIKSKRKSKLLKRNE